MTEGQALIAIYGGLLVLGLLMTQAQRRWPAIEPTGIWKRTRRIDFAYWLFTPLITGSLTRGVTLGIVGIIAWYNGYPTVGAEAFQAARAAAFWGTGRLPLWLQAILVLVLTDFIGYWSHRFRHTRGFWPFHAIHHSTPRLDWLAAARMHPIDDIVDNVCVGLPLFFLGFDIRLFALLGPTLILHTILVHANVDWDFGVLRWVFVSPGSHRWHHARVTETRPRNFAGVFSFIDILFGTFELPRDAPEDFGTLDPALPGTLPRQLLYPFRVSK